MLNLRKIAVTGGLSSGKSTVCALMQAYGAYTVDADAIVHQLYSSHSACKEKVITLLGKDVLAHGQIDRKKIADHVFRHPKQLLALEDIVQPFLLAEIDRLYNQACEEKMWHFFVAEIPLLFERKLEGYFDITVCVLVDSDKARARFETAGRNPQEYDLRMARQLPPQEKARRADFVLTNNENKNVLKRQTRSLVEKIEEKQT